MMALPMMTKGVPHTLGGLGWHGDRVGLERGPWTARGDEGGILRIRRAASGSFNSRSDSEG
jgi:hypothetical protein